jgi:hypothetical protein
VVLDGTTAPEGFLQVVQDPPIYDYGTLSGFWTASASIFTNLLTRSTILRKDNPTPKERVDAELCYTECVGDGPNKEYRCGGRCLASRCNLRFQHLVLDGAPIGSVHRMIGTTGRGTNQQTTTREKEEMLLEIRELFDLPRVAIIHLHYLTWETEICSPNKKIMVDLKKDGFDLIKLQ